MKKTSNLLAFFLLISITLLNSGCGPNPSPACSDDILTAPYNNGLVAYYKFANGSLNDFSGNGHNGTIFGNVIATINQVGSANCAMQFGGTPSDYIKIPANAAFDFDTTTAFSIVMWYKPDASFIFDTLQMLISNDFMVGYNSSIGRYAVRLDFSPFSSNIVPIFGLSDRKNVFGDHTLSPSLYTSNAWKNLIVTYYPDLPNNKKIYLDGTLVSIDDGFDLQQDFPVPPTGDIFIGVNFHGSIDDIKIYNRLLTPSEISYLSTYVSPCCP